jgi:hypothetical protein
VKDVIRTALFLRFQSTRCLLADNACAVDDGKEAVTVDEAVLAAAVRLHSAGAAAGEATSAFED